MLSPCGQGAIRSDVLGIGRRAPLQGALCNTVSHKLNRHSNRKLNKAVDAGAKLPMQFDPRNKAYLENHLVDEMRYREIKSVPKLCTLR